jgi:hypothetical protein
VLDHRHTRALGHEADQPLAAARDDQVDLGLALHQQLDDGAIGVADDLRRRGRQAGGLEPGGQAVAQRGIGARRLGATAQDHRIAAAQTQRKGVGGHVGARLVDDGDHAERDALAADQQSIGTPLERVDRAERIRLGGHRAHGGRLRGQAALVEAQAIEHGGREPCGLRRVEVGAIGGQHGRHATVEDIGRGHDGVLALRRGCSSDHAGGRAGLPGNGSDDCLELGDQGLPLEDHQVVPVDHLVEIFIAQNPLDVGAAMPLDLFDFFRAVGGQAAGELAPGRVQHRDRLANSRGK